jgi:hypothetical protein
MIFPFLYFGAMLGNISEQMHARLEEGVLAEYEKAQNVFFYKHIAYRILTGGLEDFSLYPVVSIGQNPSHREIIAYHPDHSKTLKEAYELFISTYLPQKTGLDSARELGNLFYYLNQFIRDEVFIIERCKEEHLLSLIQSWSFDTKRTVSDFTLNESYRYLPIIPLDDFIEAGIGVCRHFALVTTYFIDRLCKEGHLSGKVFHIRELTSKLMVGVHAWSIFISTDHLQIWHIDSYADKVGNLNDPQGFQSLCNDYGESAIINEKNRYDRL